MIRVRFAPNPGGYLSLSGARVALLNFLHARRFGGRFLLRFNDLDEDHARPAYSDAIVQDLRWLGIEWDDTLRQSDNLALYQQAIERLKQAGRLYPCFESEEELRAKREFRQKRGLPTLYDRAMLKLTPAQRVAAEARGKRPHWRFQLSARTVGWRDLALGERQAKLQAISDPVLVRADGAPTPLLAGVVDDMASGVTHIIRSDESAGRTGVQIDLLDALGAEPNCLVFAHLPPLAETGTRRLARRINALSVRGLRGDGVEPLAIATCLCTGSQTVDPLPLNRLVQAFDLSRMTGGMPGFDAGRMLAMNGRLLSRLEFAAVADRLPDGATEAFWMAIRGNLDLLNEVRGWWDVVAGSIVPPVMEEDRQFLAEAERALPPEPWDHTVWTTWMEALARSTGREEDGVVQPLRLALTGEENGPALDALLPLMGRARAVNRLQIATA